MGVHPVPLTQKWRAITVTFGISNATSCTSTSAQCLARLYSSAGRIAVSISSHVTSSTLKIHSRILNIVPLISEASLGLNQFRRNIS